MAGFREAILIIAVLMRQPELEKFGAVMAAFALYFVAGGYAGQPTVWHEMVPHNPDLLWCVTLFLLDLRLVLVRSEFEKWRKF